MTAPVLDSSIHPSLPSVLEGLANPAGVTISYVTPNAAFTDPDGVAVEAFAITSVDASLGAWQYSLDGGTNWLTIDADAINSTTNELALLLGPTAMIRLLPFGDSYGTLDNAVTFRAWDQSTGAEGDYVVIDSTGGDSAFSTAQASASMTVVQVDDPDPAQTQRGTIITPVAGGAYDFGTSVTVEPGGKIVMTGVSSAIDGSYRWVIERLDDNGSLDTSFNGSGQIVPDFWVQTNNQWAWDAALRPNGQILVTGSSSYASVIARYDPDGALDASFANATGRVVNGTVQFSNAVALQPDGKMVIAGLGGDATADVAVARYNSDGSVDTSFNIVGRVMTDIEGRSDFAKDVQIRPDGRIFVLAQSNDADGAGLLAVVCYDRDGALDTSFNGTGILLTTLLPSSFTSGGIALQMDGKIVVAGLAWTSITNTDIAVQRFNDDGTLDTGFGTNGTVVTDMGAGRAEMTSRVVAQPNGKILVVASTDIDGRWDFALARYDKDGNPDTTFNGTGIVHTDVGNHSSDFAYDAYVEPDGKIVVVGSSDAHGYDQIAIARYNADGTLDESFGGSNVYRYRHGGEPTPLSDNVAVYDPTLAAANGHEGNYAGATMTVGRHDGANADDQFSATGNLVFDGADVVLSGIVVGTETNSGGQLTIEFNNQATQARVNGVVASLAYANTSDAPPDEVVIDYGFDSGLHASSFTIASASEAVVGSVTVQIVADTTTPVLNLTLTGTGGADSLEGGAGTDVLSGLAGDDTLLGFAGEDTLVGSTGTDSMNGGDGSDLYIITGAGDHLAAEIADTGATGIDETRFAATAGSVLTLFAGDTGIERVVIGTGTAAIADTTGTTALNINASAATYALTVIGNAGANTLTGTAFGDTIDGGAGADTMIGGAGNDTYTVDNTADVIKEGSTGGTDAVTSSASYTLGLNIENLALTGSATLNGVGNALANTITGNSASNLFDGKAGIDALDGVEGSDIYMIAAVADHPAAEIHDSGTTGVDEVRFAATKSSTLTLFAGDTGIDTVVIGTGTGPTAITSGTTALNVNASAVLNALVIFGSAGANKIVGTAYGDALFGGKGNDILTGGTGADLFVFDTAPNAKTNHDTITDFQSGVDIIRLSELAFAAISGDVGTISSEQFWSAAGAKSGHDPDDRVIYNTTSGILYYDPDGNGSAVAIPIALLGVSTHPALVASDIQLVP
jgi:uncharacterized delta-60 repeat protein